MGIPHIVLRFKKLYQSVGLFLFLGFYAFSTSHSQPEELNPYFVKEYPDGYRVKARWSEVQKNPDPGLKHGGVPNIRLLNKGEEGLPEVINQPGPDGKVVKVYPDGTKKVLNWSELGVKPDYGNDFGGPPKIFPYQPGIPVHATATSAPPGQARTRLNPSGSNTSSQVVPRNDREMRRALLAESIKIGPMRPSAKIPEAELKGADLSRGYSPSFRQTMGPSLQYGQAFQDYGPGLIRPAEPIPTEKPKKIYGTPEGKDDPVTSRLLGIVLLADPAKISPDGQPAVSGVRNEVSGLALEDANAILQPYLGNPLTMGQLNEICRKIMMYFDEQNQPVVSAVVPEQEVRGGVVQILVVKGKMGKVQVQGNRWFKTENIQDDIELKKGEELDLRTLTDNVAWMNSNPFRQVEPSLTPGSEPGQTDVILEVQDRLPFRPFVSYDNFGIQSLGYNRFSTGATLGDVWSGLDQQLNYQFLSTGDFNSLISNSGAYVLALPWQHNLNIFGTYSKANPNEVGLFDQSGYFWQVSMRYNIPLPTLSLLEGLDYRHQVYLGYDFKASNTDIFFQGAQLPPVPNGLVGLYNISQFTLGYSLNLVDPYGSTAFETVLYGSPGGMTSNNSNSSFQNIDGGADAQYIYGKFSLSRLFRLPGDAALFLSGQIQQADSNLMPSESFGIGGYDTVRGYDQRSANGDNAYLGNVELRTPPVSFWQIAGAGEALDQLVFLIFMDYGQVLQYSPDTISSVNWHLLSVGPGLRYNIGPYFNLRFDWGFQMQQAPPGTTGGVGGPAGTSQAVLSATLSY